jgi:hypothetical protein
MTVEELRGYVRALRRRRDGEALQKGTGRSSPAPAGITRRWTVSTARRRVAKRLEELEQKDGGRQPWG